MLKKNLKVQEIINQALQELEKHLEPDEDILWITSRKLYLNLELWTGIITGLTLIFMIPIVGIINPTFLSNNVDFIWLVQLLLIVPGSSFIYYVIRNYTKIMNYTGCTRKKLKGYIEIYAISNKRCIKKDVLFKKVEFNRKIKKNFDFVSLNIIDIVEIHVYKEAESNRHLLHFFLDEELGKTNFLDYYIPTNELLDVKEILKYLISLREKEIDKYGNEFYIKK